MANKVAIYVRVSTEDQAKEGYSIDEQIDKLKMYCKIHDWHIYEIYNDAGLSGTNMNRPALQKLINDIGNFDTVLVYKLDRLARSTIDNLHLIKNVFKKNNVEFVSLNESVDTSSPSGGFFLTVLSGMAEFEVDTIKERMQLGKIGRAKSGKSMSWAKNPFGYQYVKELGQLEIVPLQAQIVKIIFKDYLAGTSITKLRDKLNEDGHIGKDIKWSYRTLRQTLDNPVYIGKQKYKGEVYDANHEAIIDSTIYDAVQKELVIRQIKAYEQNNNPRPFQAKYMLSGRIRCGYCGAPLSVQLGKVRLDGTRVIRYACQNRTKKGAKAITVYNDGKLCDSGFYYKNEIEAYVVDAITNVKHNDQQISNMLIPQKVDIQAIETEVRDIDKKMDKFKSMYMNDLISIEELKTENDKLLKQKNSLLNEIVDKPNLVLVDKIKKVLNVDIKSLDYEEQKNLVATLVNKVDVKEGEILVHWTF